MKIAIVGIQGLPNQYGGFETLSEFLVKYLGKKHVCGMRLRADMTPF